MRLWDRYRIGIGFICLGITGLPHIAAAQTVGAVLQFPPGARAEAMGREMACLETGPLAAYGNVGGLGLSRGIQFAASRNKLVPDLSDDVYFIYVSALASFSTGRLVHGVLNANVTRVSCPLNRWLEARGDPGSTNVYGAGGNYGSGRGSQKVYGIGGGLGFGERVGIGVGVKWLQAGEKFNADPGRYLWEAHSRPIFDCGMMTKLPLKRSWDPDGGAELVCGLAVHNVGAPVTINGQRQADPLPHVFRGGLNLELRTGARKHQGGLFGRAPRFRLTAGGGFEKLPLSNGPEDSLLFPRSSFWDRHNIAVGGGVELKALGTYALRAGYLFDDPNEIRNFTYGAGLDFGGVAGLDFASVPQYTELERVKKWTVWLKLPEI